MTKATYLDSGWMTAKNRAFPVAPEHADADSVMAALEAVVLAQKAQMDALLASLERLQAALGQPKSAPEDTSLCERGLWPASPSNVLLGNPLDPQFSSLHQLMERLKRG